MGQDSFRNYLADIVNPSAAPLASSTSGGKHGVGSPEGVVNGKAGIIYVDETAPNNVWIKATDTGNTGWNMKIE